MDLFSDLKQRGVIYQSSDEEAIKEFLSSPGGVFYAGFDPTGDSLHVGNLLTIVTMKRLEKSGLKPVVLVGGATGMIGDPSGKSEERQLSLPKIVNKRTALLKKQLARFFDFKKTTIFVNNSDWFKNYRVLDFLRDIGKHFSVNMMVKKESVAQRMETETGISYTEFSYMLLQAYDFLKLNELHDCRLQIGGSDQWGNMAAGIDLVRRLKNREVYGFTTPLVITADGKKMGKTETGAVWLDAKLTSPYHFYQFWLNVDDRDAIKFLKYYTSLSLKEIENLEKSLEASPEKREAQKILAGEITAFVHGKNAVEKSRKISQALFYGNIKELKENELKEVFSAGSVNPIERFAEMNIVDFLTLSGVSSSKRQAREDVANKAIELNGTKIDDIDYFATEKDILFRKYVVVKRGRKDYHFILVK